MSGVARLYTRSEVEDMRDYVPRCELDYRFIASLHTAVPWVANRAVECAVCGKPLDGSVAYVMILLPSDPEMGLGVSGGVCGSCGGLPRTQLEAQAERMATLMFEPHAGRA